MTDILHAKNLGYKIKLLSISEIIKNKLIERVHPCLISKNSYISKVDGVLNAIVYSHFFITEEWVRLIYMPGAFTN